MVSSCTNVIISGNSTSSTTEKIKGCFVTQEINNPHHILFSPLNFGSAYLVHYYLYWLTSVFSLSVSFPSNLRVIRQNRKIVVKLKKKVKRCASEKTMFEEPADPNPHCCLLRSQSSSMQLR